MSDHTQRIAEAVEDVARRLAAALAEHEEHDHAGEPCGRAKVTVIGFLAARIGISTEGEMMLAGHWRKVFEAQMERAGKARAR